MKMNKEQLKEMLIKNKQFINYNGGTEINSIEERYNERTLTYEYIINKKVAVRYCENLGSTRRYYYLRITKVSA